MLKWLQVLLLLTAWSGAAAESETLPLSAARQAAAAAVEYARAKDAPGGAIAIVDAGGHLVYLERLDGSFPASGAISIGKARTAALFRKPTKLFEDVVNQGRTTMVALPEITPFTPLQGGVPLVRAGLLVGAIGVSGAASADQDNEIAEAGARAFAAAGPATVGYVPASVVGDAFTANRSVIVTPAFRVNPSSRSAPGEAEVHLWEADVMYVLNGAATLVTGGAVVAPRTIAPGEIRGERLEGGAVRRLSPGDVVHVPPGVPHWFSQVDGAFRYYVIKSSDRSVG